MTARRAHAPTRRAALLSTAALLLAACPGRPSVETSFIESARVQEIIAEPRPAAPAGHLSRAYPTGRALALHMANRETVNHLPARRELHRIADRLLSAWPGPGVDVEIFISPDPTNAAEATIDNQIVVTLGLLRGAATEDEIAFVLAHEIAHVLLRHIETREAGIDTQKGVVQLAAQMTGFGVQAGNSELVRSGSGYAVRTRLTQTARTTLVATAAANALLAALSDEVADPGWSRTQEDEADLLGLDLMRLARPPYNTTVAQRVMQTIAASDRERVAEAADLRGMVSGGIAEVSRSGPARSRQEGTRSIADLLTQAAPMIESAIGAALAEATHRHADAEMRGERRLAAYAQAMADDDTVPPDPAPSPFRQGRLGADLARIAEGRATVAEGARALSRGDVAGAEARLARGAGTAQQGAPADFLRARAGVHRARGNTAAAAAELTRATRLPSAPAAAFLSLAELRMELGDLAGAHGALGDGERRFGSPALFLPHRVSLYRLEGRSGEMQQALARCRAIGDRRLGDLCTRNAGERTGLFGALGP